jgi:hypothetical protein
MGEPTITSSPIPGSDVRFTNNTNTDIQIYGVLYNGDTASPPMQPGQTYILRYISDISDRVAVYNSPDFIPFDSLKITAFKDEGQEYNVPYEHYQDVMGWHYYKFSFKELREKGFTTVSIYGSLGNNTATTSTGFPTLKLINNTGDTLNVT